MLSNNLNKITKKGKRTSASAASKLYDIFEYKGYKGTIYQHDLRIVKPRKVVMFCENDYYSHINRDFCKTINKDKDFYEICKEELNKLGVEAGNEPCIEISISKDEEEKIFGLSNIRILCCMHPNAHFDRDKRKKYNDRISEFIKV